jgi:hypothetical protein
MRITALSTMLLVGVAACGNDQPAERDTAPATQQPAAAQLTMPDWFQVDHDAQTVTMDITAGSTSANNYWNFNGYVGGEGLIVVPEGYEVTINFDNQDPAMAHSIGVDARLANFPANFSQPYAGLRGRHLREPDLAHRGDDAGRVRDDHIHRVPGG